MSDQTVTLAKLSDIVEAQTLLARLKEANIPATIIDDSLGGTMPGLGDTFGLIAVQVYEHDLERADRVWEAFIGDEQDAAPDDSLPTWQCSSCDAEVSSNLSECPLCGTRKEAIFADRPRLGDEMTAAASRDEDKSQPSSDSSSFLNWVSSRQVRKRIVLLLLFGPIAIAVILSLLDLVFRGRR